MPKVIIDGKEYEVGPGRNMLQAALDHKLDLPYFCWHPAMGSVGACRLCAVRVYHDANDTKGKIQMACMTAAKDGARMDMNDPEAAEFRRYVIEWLMTNHPHDCPVCDEGGECHLQDMTAMCGHVYRRFRFKKRTYTNQYLGPFVRHEMNRCIQCYRCTRFYRDLAGGRDFNYFGSRNRVYFGRQEDGALVSEFAGNLVEVCPTGVFTDKTSAAHYTRKWDLITAPSVCIHCGLGCNTIPGARYGSIRRVTARFNGDVNGYFLCDRGRFGYEFLNHESRIWESQLREAGALRKHSLTAGISRAREDISSASGVLGIGSPRASLESNFALKKLVGEANFSTGLSAFEQSNVELALSILRTGPAQSPSLAEVELADVVIILGADPTNEAPMLDFAIRQAMRKAPLDIARKLRIPDWDANAVANALQDARGKLYIASLYAIKLEEIGALSVRGSYADVAAFAESVISNEGELASRAASDLLEARQPLIVTSVSAGPEVLKAAANLAWWLHDRGKDCWLSPIVPEANTMGVGMLGGMSVGEALARIESGAADTLVVLENDFSRRVDSAKSKMAFTKARRIVALESVETPVTASAHVVIPVAAYVESDGTFVSNEGRAQRFFQVAVPDGDRKPAWWTLQQIAGNDEWEHYEDVLRELAATAPEFTPALDAAEPASWRSGSDRKVARMSHRYSGRTAEDANVSVFEPERPSDPETPLSFSMEGDQNPPAPPLIPRFWSPGWNSENSINKFQIEVGGPLHGGNPGKRLIEPSGSPANPFPKTPARALLDGEVWLVPRARIFGSEELSRLAQGIAELIPQARLALHPDLARRLGVVDGDRVEIEASGRTLSFISQLDNSLNPGTVTVPSGFPETVGVLAPSLAKIARAK